ncbi:hypothetical protein [Dyella nitratireducens]|uniref:Uncharacterized protein n=1 Tax=Dyella nitratireducens TaxID=1849580 RepID=A0ABQ1FKD8_9GAMM|nr:hypothetical protein [Dyella nitratireducens]GGA17727.1 hypothetical protein GCM10010981_01870 [Dyella nitratireducens]GLQ44751.1 hypothetical protein GCM10007902_46010 [Dyella nitratireducens]
MKAPNPIAITAAVLFTTVSLIAVTSGNPKLPAAPSNGEKVFTLPGIEVHPTAEDRRAASLLSEASLTIANSPLANKTESAASLLGAQLAMPYYSFGSTKFAGISKE